MGNSIFAGILNFIPILSPLALVQERSSSPPAQPSPALAPVALGVVVGFASTGCTPERSVRPKLQRNRLQPLKAVMITLVLCFPMVAQNAEKKLSFRSFVPGMTFDAFRKAYDARLESEAQKKGNQYATYQFQGYLECKQLAPGLQRCINTVDGVMADFYSRRLATLYWRFPHDQFSQIREGLIEKFGTHKTHVARIQNRMGAQFDDEILSWSSEAATLELSEYVSTLDNSAVTLQDNDLAQSFKKHEPKPSPDI